MNGLFSEGPHGRMEGDCYQFIDMEFLSMAGAVDKWALYMIALYLRDINGIYCKFVGDR